MNIRTLTISTHNPPAGGPNRETMVTPVESSYTKLTESLLRSGVRPGIRGSNSSGTRLTQAMRAEKRPLSPASIIRQSVSAVPSERNNSHPGFRRPLSPASIIRQSVSAVPSERNNSHPRFRRPLSPASIIRQSVSAVPSERNNSHPGFRRPLSPASIIRQSVSAVPSERI